MRVLRFRAKRLDNGEWVYGHFSLKLNTLYYKLIPSIQIVLPNGNVLARIEVEGETVGQFIGETDKNGKDIFEGDIIKDDSIGAFGTVEFTHGQFVLNDIDDEIQEIWDWSSFKVVGNKYDNPDPNEWYKL